MQKTLYFTLVCIYPASRVELHSPLVNSSFHPSYLPFPNPWLQLHLSYPLIGYRVASRSFTSLAGSGSLHDSCSSPSLLPWASFHIEWPRFCRHRPMLTLLAVSIKNEVLTSPPFPPCLCVFVNPPAVITQIFPPPEVSSIGFSFGLPWADRELACRSKGVPSQAISLSVPSLNYLEGVLYHRPKSPPPRFGTAVRNSFFLDIACK